MLFWSASADAVNYPMVTEDGIRYRYDERNQPEIELGSIPTTLFASLKNIEMIMQAVRQLRSKRDWRKIALLSNGVRYLPCRRTTDFSACRDLKGQMVRLMRVLNVRYPRALRKALNENPYALFQVGGQFFLRDLRWGMVVVLERSAEIKFVPERIGEHNRKNRVVYQYEWRGKEFQGGIYLELFQKLRFRGLEDYTGQWVHRGRLPPKTKFTKHKLTYWQDPARSMPAGRVNLRHRGATQTITVGLKGQRGFLSSTRGGGVQFFVVDSF